MKKIHLIIQSKDINAALENLRALGIMHVQHLQNISGHHLAHLREDVELLKTAVLRLKETGVKVAQKKISDWRTKAEEIKRDITEIESMSEDIAKRQALINQWKSWGHFSVDDIEFLKSKGIFIQLFTVPAKKEIRLPEGVGYQVIFKKDKINYCVAYAKSEFKLDYKTVALPPKSLNELEALRDKERNLIQKAEERIRDNVKFLGSLEDALIKAQEKLKFEEVAYGMKKEDTLAVLKGFAPADVCPELERKGKEHNWGLLIEDPSESDNVPTLLRNPKWVDMIKPIYKFIDIIPGYKEMDVSVIFLMFFSVFVGMIIGDAAYGMLIMLLTAVAHIKFRKKLQEPMIFYLMYLLSSMTILWGVCTATYFGQNWLPEGVHPLIPWLRDMENIQLVCFVIAVIHLTIAYIWRILMRFPSLEYLSEIGWLCLIWTMFFAANYFVLNFGFPQIAYFLLYSGIFLILLFTKPNKNPLKAIGPGLGKLAMNFMNAFTDVVSYIRLFAVGLATVAVADAFNEMALSIGFSNVVAGISSALILIFGHILNIILAGLAVIVHGVRLNVLEFSSHINLEWNGFKFEPFKKIK